MKTSTNMNYRWFLMLLIFSFYFNNIFAQKSYKFDTLLRYECHFLKNDQDSISIQYIFTNSKDNSYNIQIKEKDRFYYYFIFNDFENYYSEAQILKSRLFESNLFEIDNCIDVFKFYNKYYKSKTKHYSFITLEDSIINNEALHKYKLVCLRSERKKRRKKIGSNTYIIKNDTQYHLPILRLSTAYYEWKLEHNIPNGVYHELIFKNHNGEIQNHYKLQEIKSVDITLNIVEPCQPKLILISVN